MADSPVFYWNSSASRVPTPDHAGFKERSRRDRCWRGDAVVLDGKASQNRDHLPPGPRWNLVRSHGARRIRFQLFEELPAILDQLTEWVLRLRNRKRRERDREPTIRGIQQHRPRFLVTFVVEVLQVRVASSRAGRFSLREKPSIPWERYSIGVATRCRAPYGSRNAGRVKIDWKYGMSGGGP